MKKNRSKGRNIPSVSTKQRFAGSGNDSAPAGFRIHISGLTLSDESDLTLESSALVLFVGPNNAGKSQALRDIGSLLARESETRVITSVDPQISGTDDDIVAWVLIHGGLVNYQYRVRTREIPESVFGNRVVTDRHISDWASLLTHHAGARERLTSLESGETIDFSQDVAKTTLDVLHKREDYEKALSSLAKEAFDINVVVDRLSGRRVSLKIVPGGEQVPENADIAVQRAALSALRSIDVEGDGIKSYLGVAADLVIGDWQIAFIDEADAFLHPPQAHRMGRLLASKAAELGRQVFVATHSGDLVAGALDSGRDNVSIVRVTRKGSINPSTVLEPSDLRELWKDPILRYSGMLDGLFHDAVVIAESDADCRFYQSILDMVWSNAESRLPEVKFAHSGGKSAVKKLLGAMLKVGVPTWVIADLDALNDEEALKSWVTLLGRDWREYDRDWRILQGALKSQLGGGDLKRSGMRAFPQGEASEAAESLLRRLATQNVFLVPVGELERFVPQVASHGSQWLREVHENEFHSAANAPEAHRFVNSLAESLLSLIQPRQG